MIVEKPGLKDKLDTTLEHADHDAGTLLAAPEVPISSIPSPSFQQTVGADRLTLIT